VALVENTLFGIDNKIEIALTRIKTLRRVEYMKARGLDCSGVMETPELYFNW
jgi:hypothetical protein